MCARQRPALILLVFLTPICCAKADEQPDPPRPEWIWSADAGAPGQVRTFTTEFSVDTAPGEARLKLATEYCRCIVSVNGRDVVELDNFGPLVDVDATDWIKTGVNNICITAVADYGPSAVAASLIATTGDQQSNLVTDRTWQIAGGEDIVPYQLETLGAVSPQFWISRRQSRVTAFDDYTQWKQAQSENAGDPTVARLAALPGFDVQIIRKARPDEGSWVSMAFDPQGRITIAREDTGLLRLTLSDDPEQQLMETINDNLKECRGLLYTDDALYANANNSKGLYKLTSSEADDRFDNIELLREFPGGVGHGRNDLALGPDGLIYSIHGDSVQLPREDVNDLTSPFRDQGKPAAIAQGHLVRCDKSGQNWDIVATGLRNPFGIGFNPNGDLFTYDADAEFDMGAPWYRPTRLNHLTAGADFGWRGLTRQWPPYELDHADNALPVATIGKGSPTAIKFATRSNFPKPWKDALFILDWAYGRIVACHLFPRGASYASRSQVFLQGRPLNVTDLDFGPDGSLYFVTGGRKTESSLYRVRWVGVAPDETQQVDDSSTLTQQQQRREAWTTKQRQRRAQIEALLSDETDDWEARIFDELDSSDPAIRRAAAAALEHLPRSVWSKRALKELNPANASVALLSLSRGLAGMNAGSGQDKLRRQILNRLLQLPTSELSLFDQLTILQAFTLCLQKPEQISEAQLIETHDHLNEWFKRQLMRPNKSFPPTGAGDSVTAKLSRLIMQLEPEFAHPLIINLLAGATDQQSQIFYLFLLRTASQGWQHEDRVRYLTLLNSVERSFLGGDGMPGFLTRIRTEFGQTLQDAEKNALSELLNSAPDRSEDAMKISRAHVRDWEISDLDELLSAGSNDNGDPGNGRRLFHEVLCSRCHRVGQIGGVVGPDLTSVAGRFGKRDLLRSILAPSEVVAQKYRHVAVRTNDGKTITGKILASGDYRSPSIRIATDPLNPARITEVLKADIEDHVTTQVSPMPAGLLSTLTAAEVADLTAYLLSGDR